jgi:hypothetical protein
MPVPITLPGRAPSTLCAVARQGDTAMAHGINTEGKQEKRMFFFEKKNQKTFVSLGWCRGMARLKKQTFFGSL